MARPKGKGAAPPKPSTKGAGKRPARPPRQARQRGVPAAAATVPPGPQPHWLDAPAEPAAGTGTIVQDPASFGAESTPADLGALAGRETLAAIAAEVRSAEPAAAAELVDQPPPAVPSEELAFGCTMLAGMVADIVTDRAGVSRLTDAERARLGRALANVTAIYLPETGSPEMLAWATLALAVGSVAVPRIKEARAVDAGA
jgi:hypothetical protein